jgi:5'(3')-deoxyribonucleotidase
MSKPIIAVDIDEVLSPLHAPFLNYHNKEYGTEYAYPDTQGRYYLQEFTGETFEQAERKIHDFVDHESFAELVIPLPGAIEAAKRLKAKGYRLIVVTSRQPFYDQVTKDFIAEHFPDVFEAVHFIPYYLGSALTPGAAKVEICQDLGVQYLIEDNLETAKLAGKAGIEAILFGEYHWNKQAILPANVTRCKDWAAVEKYFDGIAHG